jgi:hypothetical protein
MSKCNSYLVSDYAEQTILKNLIVDQLVKEFPAFYGTQRFITVFTTVPPLDPLLS